MLIVYNCIEATSRRLRQSLRLTPESILVPVLTLGLAAVISGCAPRASSTPAASTPTASQAAPSVTSPTLATSVTPSQPVSLSITSPSGVVHCKDPAPQCQFQVTLRTTGTVAQSQEILVLVDPLKPSGGGWFIQLQPANLQADGSWLQNPADIGSSTAPAHKGDTLQLEAVVVRVGATYNRRSLEAISKAGESILDPRQINGLVSLSTAVQVTVMRP